jgi:hypothetical protein
LVSGCAEIEAVKNCWFKTQQLLTSAKILLKEAAYYKYIKKLKNKINNYECCNFFSCSAVAQIA